jgi:signal transduction histidine kinase
MPKMPINSLKRPGQTPPSDAHATGSSGTELQAGEAAGVGGEAATDDRFHVDASVVFQLGESLVSDVVQALVELVKNAYDADANFARIIVDTDNAPASGLVEIDIGTQSAPESPGYILIEDDGTGMTREVIRQGWLTISRSPKRTFKRELRVTDKGRTPLGDKGLGRLGVQRLGNRVQILTRAAGADGQPGDEHVVVFAWSDFLHVTKVEEVDVVVRRNESPILTRPGTRIVVTGLYDTATWRDRAAQQRLQDELSQMISPYAEISNFRAVVTINGGQVDLAEVTRVVRDTARIHYDVNFDGERLKVTGRAKLAFFRPPGGEERQQFAELLERDDGARFFEHLRNRLTQLDDTYAIRSAKDKNWYLTFNTQRRFADIPRLAKVGSNAANPGPFRGEIDSFDFGAEATHDQHVFSKAAEYKKYLQSLSGVRVYRDGFGIRIDRDWLGLSKASTSGSSYYGLRPANTIGYVALTARHNQQLEEKTDREGFKQTPSYENFRLLMDLVVGFTAEVQDFLRREYVAFRNLHEAEVADVVHDVASEDLAAQIRIGLASAKKGDALVSRVSQVLDRIGEEPPALRALTNANLRDDARRLVDQLAGHWSSMSHTVVAAKETLGKVNELLEVMSSLAPKSNVLANRVVRFREQIEEVYELASLGLTTEALTHEISNIAEHLKGRTNQAQSYLRRKQSRDAELLSFVDAVSSAVAALRKQLGHLDPSLRFARDRREVIDLHRFFAGVGLFYKERLGAKDISFQVSERGRGNFSVRMSRGRLVQVTDNILLNSEYWLAADLDVGQIKQASIRIVIDAPHVYISDTGRGVLRELEGILFEPFVTGKGRGRGRGLGLFIVEQLLDADDCTIALSHERNDFDRRYIFDLDLSGARHDES